ncbi:LysM peptidoglycan-binding domain-containing protein [Flavobacterium sp.]
MNKIKITSLALILLTSVGFAQDTFNTASIKIEPLSREQYLDSIKGTFVRDNLAACIDSMWMKELANLDLFDELTLDIKNIDVDQKVDYELPTELLKERLKKLDEKSAFNIEYNEGLENVIKSFLKNRRKSFERLMGISQYYFPIFEESLAAQNIPLEIKYLAVVESALNPRAVSRVGATGLWQFMYQTGKQYNLNIDTYVDERSDPLKASNAATQYMKNMYKIFGDWDLVLASYNSGPGNVAKAIRRSGGKQNYWNIRPFLHKETQGYVPAFLATMYIFEYHKEHGIVPNKAIANHFATDTVNIKSKMTFKQISDLLDLPIAQLQFLNPSYKRDVVPYITGENHYLRLPIDKIARFVSNEDKIYAYINYEDSFRERPYLSKSAVASNSGSSNSKVKYHKVKRGDTLGEISESYGVSLAELKKWNKIRGNYAPLGRSLKIYTQESVADVEKKATRNDTVSVKQSKSAVASNGKNYSEEKVFSNKDVVKYHKVKRGDNIGEIANKYDVSVAEVKKWNKLKSNNIGLGATLKIIKNERVATIVRKEIKGEKINTTIEPETQIASNQNSNEDNPEDFYVVQKGDNLFTIAKKFNVSLEDLKDWNNIEDGIIQSGSKIALNNAAPNAKQVEEAPKAETKIVEYVVKNGDNLGGIAKKYSASISDIKDWNELQDDNITIGSKLIVSKKLFVVPTTVVKISKKQSIAQSKKVDITHYFVKKGDSLFSIAKKYPGVTISDIKKWNDIGNESIKPGMKLRING